MFLHGRMRSLIKQVSESHFQDDKQVMDKIQATEAQISDAAACLFAKLESRTDIERISIYGKFMSDIVAAMSPYSGSNEDGDEV